MQKIRRIAWLALGGIIGIFVILLLGVNLYVQSQGTQARIQQELSQRLDTPLQIRRISVTPWGGLKLSGITIPQTNSAVDTPFLEAKTFRLRIRFASLFSRRLVIKEISLLRPEVVWTQNADGKMALAYAPKRNRDKREPIAGAESASAQQAERKVLRNRANSCASIRDFVSLHRPIRPPSLVRSRNPPRLSKGWRFSLSG